MSKHPEGARPSSQATWRGFVWREAPYLMVLALVLCGSGYSSLMRAPLESYWAMVAVFNCAACIFAGWGHFESRRDRVRLIWTQLLHWGAFVAVMGLVFSPSVDADDTANAASVAIMLLLALGTFVAGVHTLSWRMALNGIVIALIAPIIAWLDQAAAMLSLFGVLAAVVLIWALLRWRRGTRIADF